MWPGSRTVFLLIISGLLGRVRLGHALTDTSGDELLYRTESTSCSASCHRLPLPSCYGEQYPYSCTSSSARAPSSDDHAQLPSEDFFRAAHRFRFHPACWTAIQPLLCAVWHPKCKDGRVPVLSRKICDQAMLACRRVAANLPDVLSNCSDPLLFGQEDTGRDDMDFANEMLSLSFNKTDGACPPPLARTTDPAKYYDGITGCGMQCEDPFLSPVDVGIYHTVVLCLAVACVFLNAFGLASIILKMRVVRSAPFNPDRCVLYMNLSFVISSVGYLLQFFPDTRSFVTCSEDGLRQRLIGLDIPTARSGLCLLSFLLTYVFTLSGLVWFGHLMFACFLDFQKIINSHRKTKVTTFLLARSSLVFFHGTAWLLPLVPALAMVLLDSVQGNSLLGICWIAPRYKTAFVITPFALVLAIAVVFTGLYWWNLRKSQLSQFGTLKTQQNVLRRLRLVGGICAGVLVLHFLQLAGIWCVVYNERTWHARLQQFTQCQLLSLTSENPDAHDCSAKLETVRKSYLGAFYAMMVPYFVTGLAISMWTWNSANIRRWTSLFKGGKLSDMKIHRNGSKIIEELELKDDIGDVTLASNRLLIMDPIMKRAYSIPRNCSKAEVVANNISRQASNSTVPGQNINSVEEFDPDNKLENWQERARECRLGRRKSDIGVNVGAGFRVSGNHQSHHNFMEGRVVSTGKSLNRTSSHGSALHRGAPREAHKPPELLNAVSSNEFIEF